MGKSLVGKRTKMGIKKRLAEEDSDMSKTT
jgi:hypothetical protein